MSTEIAAYTPPTQSEIEYTWNLANKLCKTEFVPANLRGKPEATLAVFLTGRELGIGPMQSLRDIYPVNGRPSMMARLMVDRVRAYGHRFKTLKWTEREAVVQIHRKDDPDPEPPVTFTWDDAKRAKLDHKEIYQLYPKQMLWSRAASTACRRDAGECLGAAIYTPDELEDGHGSTTATWGSPEGPPLPEQEAPEPSDPGPASAPPRPSPGSDPTSEGPATRTDEASGQPGRPRGRPSDPTSEAGERPVGHDAARGSITTSPASDTNASVTGSGPAQEPPNAEAPTSPVSPGDGKAGRGRRGGRADPGREHATDSSPAAPSQSALDDAGPEPPGWEQP